MGKDVVGVSHYRLVTNEQKGWADCTDDHSGRTYRKKPGDTQKSISENISTLMEKDLGVNVGIYIDRFSNSYSFKFSVSGLWWQGNVTKKDIYTDVCNGGSKEKSYGPFE